jgi:hypothetical protein
VTRHYDADRVRHEMRTSGPLGILQDFQAALDYAVQGAVVSDTGLPQSVEDALDKVRDASPNPPQALIDAARETFLRSRRPK